MTSTITAAAGTFESSGSAILTLYNVQTEDIRKNSGLIEFPMPTMDSNGKIVMDLMGASREITIEGIVTSNDVSQLDKYARDIAGLQGTAGTYNTLISGAQGGTYGKFTYASQVLSANISVVVSEASIKNEKGNPNSKQYSITMMEYGTLI
jgi:hypothetical protein